MMRSFAYAFLCSLVFCGCRGGDGMPVTPAPPELVEIDLAETGHRLSFMLPDGWRRTPESVFDGFLFALGERSLRVRICLKEDRFAQVVAEARGQADGAEIRSFEPGSPWPFVGIVVSYRGPPDVPLLDAFQKSFKVERR